LSKPTVEVASIANLNSFNHQSASLARSAEALTIAEADPFLCYCIGLIKLATDSIVIAVERAATPVFHHPRIYLICLQP
jgi:hypothetical protein